LIFPQQHKADWELWSLPYLASWQTTRPQDPNLKSQVLCLLNAYRLHTIVKLKNPKLNKLVLGFELGVLC
jgi:hypothetical protein